MLLAILKGAGDDDVRRNGSARVGTRLVAVSVGVEVTVFGVNEAPALATDAGKSGMALSERGTDNGTDVADVVWEAPR